MDYNRIIIEKFGPPEQLKVVEEPVFISLKLKRYELSLISL